MLTLISGVRGRLIKTCDCRSVGYEGSREGGGEGENGGEGIKGDMGESREG